MAPIAQPIPRRRPQIDTESSDLQRSQSTVSLGRSALFGFFGSTAGLSDLSERDDSANFSPKDLQTADPDRPIDRTLKSRSMSDGKPDSPHLSRSTSHRPSFNQSSSFSTLSKRRQSTASIFKRVLLRNVGLFLFAMAYGIPVTHLYDHHLISPYTLEIVPPGVRLALFWGVFGVTVGLIFVAMDKILPRGSYTMVQRPKRIDWRLVMRSACALMGVSYAIRNLPWTSTAQLSLVFTIFNVALWYALDASLNGFFIASSIAVTGTAVFAELLPNHFPGQVLSYDYWTVVCWVASLIFCSTTCIGQVGRKLGDIEL